MSFVKMNRGGNHRGQKYSKGTILEVSESLKQRIVSNNQGFSSTQEEFDKQNETVKQNEVVDYMSLNRESLNSYAISLGLNEENVKNEQNKAALQELVKAALETV
jgi:hypothetical protein